MLKRLNPNSAERIYLRFSLKGFLIEIEPDGGGFTVEAYLPSSMLQFAAWQSNGTPEDTNELLGHLCSAILQLHSGETFLEDVPFASFARPSIRDRAFRDYLSNRFPAPDGVEYLCPFDLLFCRVYHTGQLYTDFHGTPTLKELSASLSA